MEKVHKFTLDINRGTNVSNITTITGDYASHKLLITLVEDGYKPVNLEDTIVRLVVRKPDDTTVQQDCTIIDTNGVVSVLLKLNTINVKGTCKAELQLWDNAVANKRLTSAQFSFKVRKSLQDDETVESTDQFSMLQSALEQAQNIDEKIQNKADLDETGKVPLSQLPEGIGDTELRQEVETARGGYASLNDRLGNTEIDVVNLGNNLDTHLAKSVADVGGVHGLEYEEGTWIPVFAGNEVAGSNSYAIQIGRYVRQGNVITVEFGLKLSAKDSNMKGIIRIGGLPFTPKAIAPGGISIGRFSGITLDPDTTHLTGYVVSGGIYIYQNGSNLDSKNLNVSNLSSNSEIRGNATYTI